MPGPESTTELLQRERADAERLMNGVRLVIIGLLGMVAVVYSSRLTSALNWVNVVLMAPMLLWAIGQQILVHGPRRIVPWLSTANACVDSSAVTLLLFGYGFAGMPDLAVKSPIWVAYFVILAARPFTSSARNSAIASAVVVVEYSLIVLTFTVFGQLQVLDSPLAAAVTSGTSGVDEGAKILLLLVAGCVATYATGWNQRTLAKAQYALRASETELRALVGAMADVIVAVDRDGRYIKIAPSAAEARFRPPGDWVGRRLHQVLPSDTAEMLLACVRRALESRRPVDIEYSVEIGGQLVWFAATMSPMSTDSVVWVARDITSRKALESQLAYQALHDPLTGLANRTLFRDRVEHALASAGRGTGQIAVLLLDVDDFKTVNDSLGHGKGDQLLEALAGRLLNATRGCDTVARLGGDEFAVLLENVHVDADAIIVADRIEASLRSPIALDGTVVPVSVTIGIARAGAGDGPEELLRNADVALYTAKGAGKARYAIFAPAMHQALVDRMAIAADLREGIAGNQLTLLYQPIVELETGEIIAVEALVRWVHPERGMLPPALFIPLAEETGLIVPLGRWVIREACRQGARWQADGDDAIGRPLSISINLSGRQLESEELAGDVRAALDESGLAPERLVLEITESAIMEDVEATLEKLHQLKMLGVRLAIDDFGTGYSSLSSLQRFPIDILKIDKAFVDGIVRGGSDAALARTIIALGDTLSLRTVAEGIEHQKQRTLLRDLGCELGQGYLFAKPLRPQEIRDLLGPKEVQAGSGRTD